MLSLLVFCMVSGAATGYTVDPLCTNLKWEFLNMFQRLGDYGEHCIEQRIIWRLCDAHFVQGDECKLMVYGPQGLLIPKEPSNKTFIQKLEPGIKRSEVDLERELGENCPYWTYWESIFLDHRGQMKYPISDVSPLLLGKQSWASMKFEVREMISETFKNVLNSLNNNV